MEGNIIINESRNTPEVILDTNKEISREPITTITYKIFVR